MTVPPVVAASISPLYMWPTASIPSSDSTSRSRFAASWRSLRRADRQRGRVAFFDELDRDLPISVLGAA